ncbi:hypothetical protein SLE2022_266010 [Rubroshorea leprosula]
MPKERRDRSMSFDRHRRSPVLCSSSHSHPSSPKNPPDTEENLKEWEEARCPVCMEHPHNAILLICSSHDKGCRPYMCDTSYRHSNCFDQFQKSFGENSSANPPGDGTQLLSTNSLPSMTRESTIIDLQLSSIIPESTITDFQDERREEGPPNLSTIPFEDHMKPKLLCPLCRGQIKDWIVVEPARQFMNAKSRSCSCETCDFSGTYADLRTHARLEHPSARPSEIDPERQRNWRRLERQRDLGDLFSTLQSSLDERNDDSSSLIDDGSWLTVFFLIRVLRPSSSPLRPSSSPLRPSSSPFRPSSSPRPRSSSWSSPSRARAQPGVRRRSTRLWGESYDGETGSSPRDEDNESSDGSSISWRRRVRRRTTPDEQQ